MEKICTLHAVRADEDMPPELWTRENGEGLMLRAYNEAGYSYAQVDFVDLLKWISSSEGSQILERAGRCNEGRVTSRTLVAFEIGATGQRIYVDPAHVYAVYDQEPGALITGEWRRETAATPKSALRNGHGDYWHQFAAPRSSVIAVGTQALVVPYTADQALAILFPGDVS